MSILDVCENDDNGTGQTNSNFADDEVEPYISDPKLITRFRIQNLTKIR